MRVFVAGATGVLGRQLLPLLASHGHDVIGMARGRGADVLGSPYVELVTADALDFSAVSTAVRRGRAGRHRQSVDRNTCGAEYPADGPAVPAHQSAAYRRHPEPA